MDRRAWQAMAHRVTKSWTRLSNFTHMHPGGQCLRLQVPNARGLGSIPGQGTRSHMPQLSVHIPRLKILQLKDPACHN